MVIGQGGAAGSVEMGRSGTIVKPINLPTAPVTSHAPIMYQTQDGDTVQSLADRFHVSGESIRWSNGSDLQNVANDLRRGQNLIIPPVDGVAVLSAAGQTPRILADTYHADVMDVMRFNYIRTADTDQLPAGTPTVIPGGRGPDLIQPASSRFGNRALGGAGSPMPIAWGGSLGGNPFPYGQCTWWAYHMKPVPWNGNAIEWFGQAQRFGWLTGRAPQPGSIMVSAESWYGHVSYVTAVNADGSWTVSEMNYLGLGRVDQRTIRPPFFPLVGFIYGPPS